MKDNAAREIMVKALATVKEQNGGAVPGRLTVVEVSGQPVRVYGISPVKTIVTVQFTVDGRNYSADLGAKSGKFGKVHSWAA